jgi:hypothetical protein
MFCEVFLTLSKFCQPYDNFGENTIIMLCWYNFSLRAGNPGSQWSLLFLEDGGDSIASSDYT